MTETGSLVKWRENAGVYGLSAGQFFYCCSPGHLDDIIVAKDFNENALKNFISQIENKELAKYIYRISPRFWDGKMYGAPLPVSDTVIENNILYSGRTADRPAFPQLNRITGMALLKQFRRLFQIRFLMHINFAQDAMNEAMMGVIESNFEEIFFPSADEESLRSYQQNVSYNMKDLDGHFSYNLYINRFQEKPLYGKADNINKVTKWNYSELETTIKPFETLVCLLLGYKFKTTSGKYMKLSDFKTPSWNVGTKPSPIGASDSWVESSTPGAPDLHSWLLREVQHQSQTQEDTKRKINNPDEPLECFRNISLLVEYVRHMSAVGKKEVRKSKHDASDERYNSLEEKYNNLEEKYNSVSEKYTSVGEKYKRLDEKYRKLESSHENLLRLLLSGSQKKREIFEEPLDSVCLKRAKYFAVNCESATKTVAYMEGLKESHLEPKHRKKLAKLIHSDTIGV